MNYNVPLRNTIMVPSRASGTKQIKVPSRNTITVPSRTSGTKQIMVVEALETTVNINSILELL
jgi:hypothetical protein